MPNYSISIRDFEDLLGCKHCIREIMVKPCLRFCGHSFCDNCFTSQTNLCPTCNINIDSVAIPNYQLREVIDILIQGNIPIDALEERMECRLCLGGMYPPVLLTCGHSMCLDCAGYSVHTTEACPFCRTYINVGQQNTTLKELIIRLRELLEHIDTT